MIIHNRAVTLSKTYGTFNDNIIFKKSFKIFMNFIIIFVVVFVVLLLTGISGLHP